MPQKSADKTNAWKEKIKSWRESSLSAKNWCLKNNENHHQFRYWRQALKVLKSSPIFEELKKDSAKHLSSSTISVTFNIEPLHFKPYKQA